jgi:hypothetical protein
VRYGEARLKYYAWLRERWCPVTTTTKEHTPGGCSRCQEYECVCGDPAVEAYIEAVTKEHTPADIAPLEKAVAAACAEMDRLREVIREMREALEAMTQNVITALESGMIDRGLDSHLSKNVRDAEAALQKVKGGQ